MAKLKRDERVCPFCAETIKASAIKCRFCQSDVTPIDPPEIEVAALPEAEAAPTVIEDVKADRPSRSERLAPVYKNLTVLLAALVALAAIGIAALWFRAEQSSSVTAPNGVLVGENARTEVIIAAADLATRTLSYDYKTLDNDMEIARARMTRSFREEYDATMAQVKANTLKNKLVLQGAVVASSIIKATEHKATVLVFLNQTTTAGVGKKATQQINRNSLVVTLTRGDGDWDISKLTALG